MIDFANAKSIFIPEGEVAVIARGGEVLWRKQKYSRELLYLESTGTQWIDLGATINTTTDEVEFVFQLTEPNVYKWIFGEHDNAARFGIGSGDGANKRNVAYGNNTYKVTDAQAYNSKHTFVANQSGVFIDTAKIANFAAFASSSSLYLFNLNLNGGSYMGGAKVWAYKHSRNGAPLLDLIPVLDSNGVPCMFDKVSEQFFYNKGAGVFLYGEKQTAPYKTELAYLESTDAQFINAGYVPNTNTKIELYAGGINANTFTTTSGGWFVGSRTNYQQEAIGAYYNPGQQALYGAFGNHQSSVAVPSSAFYGKDHLFEIDKSGLYLNGNKRISFNNPFQGKYPLYLFTINLAGAPATVMRFKLYYCKVWDNGVLIRDLIPILDWDDVPCMYDKVSGKLFHNAGKGEFLYG